MQLDYLLDRIHSESAAGREPTPGPFLTISRQAGCGGADVAVRLGEVLGWKVLDRELIEVMAGQLELEPRLLQLIDETRVDWFSETLLNLFNSKLVLQGSFVSMLSHTIAAVACDGPVIVVGRAGNLVLPPDRGLRVRCVAPRSYRLARIAEREGLKVRAAQQWLDKVDAAREEFVRRHFHVDPSDPQHYDMVVDVSRFGVDGTASVIQRALEIRGVIS
jgi:cytidylate kinase